jgi:hypothetical protein
MTHLQVINIFKSKFSLYSNHIKEWFPNGKNSVRIRLKNGQEFVFTHNTPSDWCFETIDSFIKRLRGE